MAEESQAAVEGEQQEGGETQAPDPMAEIAQLRETMQSLAAQNEALRAESATREAKMLREHKREMGNLSRQWADQFNAARAPEEEGPYTPADDVALARPVETMRAVAQDAIQAPIRQMARSTANELVALKVKTFEFDQRQLEAHPHWDIVKQEFVEYFEDHPDARLDPNAAQTKFYTLLGQRHDAVAERAVAAKAAEVEARPSTAEPAGSTGPAKGPASEEVKVEPHLNELQAREQERFARAGFVMDSSVWLGVSDEGK